MLEGSAMQMKETRLVQPTDRQNRGKRRRAGSNARLTIAALLAGGLLSLWLSPSRAAGGQFAPVTEEPMALGQDDAPAPGQDNADAANNGPVRMARFSYISGDVTWRDGTEGDWSSAARNLPLRQGAQIWVSEGGRAELQFDDGSRLRLDSNTLITLQTLYSDAQGEFTEITLNDGQAFLRLNNQYSLYQVNAPEASIKAAGPGRLRVGAGEGAQFAVRQGKATIDGANGKVTLQQGDYLDVVDNTTPYNVGPLPAADDWDAWNDSRDRSIDQIASPHLPSNIALVAGNLDAYGSWHDDPQYGWVWAPRVVDTDWRPYGAGHWTWVEPYGWTWVADETWGWAPYHYGTWVHEPFGWAWCPGPATQYWSPAVVSFYQVGTRVAWCPLAPREVVYPSALAVGFHGSNWSLFFSIGSAAVYYPGPNHVCVARPWPTGYVNHVTYVNNVTNVTNVTNITVNHNTYVNNGFVPANARFQGGTQVEVQNFASSRAAYRPVAASDISVFTHGQVIGAPTAGRPVAGPQSVPVTRQSFTPSHAFRVQATAPQEVVNRSVFRAAPPAGVPRTAPATLPGQRFVTRSVQPNRPTGPGNASGRTNPGSGNVGRSSALDEYLRERGGNGNANPSYNRSNSSGAGNGNNGYDRSNGNNGYDRNNGNTQVNPRSNDQTGTNRNDTRSYDRTGSGAPSAPNRSVTPRPNGTPSNYRPLHTRPVGGGTRDNSNSGGRNTGGNGKSPSDRSGNDRGH
jgi:hypothetical protein